MVTWFNKKLCDHGYYINLEHRVDRKNSCEKELTLCGIKGVERFNAIKIDGEFKDFGCTESHLEIARRQIINNWEYVLYLEDDIETVYHYSSYIPQEKVDKEKLSSKIIDELYKHKPDVLWLGVRLEDFAEPFSDTFIIPKKTLMSHGYIGSLNFAKFLVEYLDYRKENYFANKWPIDFFISQAGIKSDWTIRAFESKDFLNNNIKILATSPLIFTQKKSHSDLTNNFTDYSLWVQSNYEVYGNFKNLNINPILL